MKLMTPNNIDFTEVFSVLRKDDQDLAEKNIKSLLAHRNSEPVHLMLDFLYFQRRPRLPRVSKLEKSYEMQLEDFGAILSKKQLLKLTKLRKIRVIVYRNHWTLEKLHDYNAVSEIIKNLFFYTGTHNFLFQINWFYELTEKLDEFDKCLQTLLSNIKVRLLRRSKCHFNSIDQKRSMHLDFLFISCRRNEGLDVIVKIKNIQGIFCKIFQEYEHNPKLNGITIRILVKFRKVLTAESYTLSSSEEFENEIIDRGIGFERTRKTDSETPNVEYTFSPFVELGRT